MQSFQIIKYPEFINIDLFIPSLTHQNNLVASNDWRSIITFWIKELIEQGISFTHKDIELIRKDYLERKLLQIRILVMKSGSILSRAVAESNFK